MDRVRALIGQRRARAGRVPARASNSHSRNNPDRTANQYYMNDQINNNTNDYGVDDDEATVFDEHRENDTGTLYTAFSEGDTIGDLETRGFVNRCPRFSVQRSMPFVSVVLSRGFYCFPSQRAYQVYLDNGRKFQRVSPKDALGIPLYHAIPLNVVKSMFGGGKNEPIMKIYRYVVADRGSAIPSTFELVSSWESDNLYRYEFCLIYMKQLESNLRLEHTFIFRRWEGKDELHDVIVPMVNYVDRRNADTHLDGLNLRWYGSTGLASYFGATNIKLLVLDDHMPSYMDQKTLGEFDEYSRSRNFRPLGHLPIWARYSDDHVNVIPKKRTLCVATFDVAEEANSASSETMNLNVSWNTEILTCMCMLLHEYESRKERRHIMGVNPGLATDPFTASFM